MFLAVHYRVMMLLVSLGSTQEVTDTLIRRLDKLLRFFRVFKTS